MLRRHFIAGLSIGSAAMMSFWFCSRNSRSKLLGGASAICFSPIASTFFLVTRTGQVLRTDITSNQLDVIAEVSLDSTCCIECSPDGKIIAIGGWAFSPAGDSEAVIALVFVESGEVRIVREPTLTTVSSISFSPMSNCIAIGSPNGPALILPSPQFQTGNIIGHSGVCMNVSFSPNGHVLATGGGTARYINTVMLWNPVTAKEIGRLIWEDDFTTLGCLAFSRDGSRIAAGGGHGQVGLWEISSGKFVKSFCQGINEDICYCKWLPSGKVFVSMSMSNFLRDGFEGHIRIWDAVSATVDIEADFKPASPHLIAVSPTEDKVAFLANGQFVRVIECNS